MSAPPSWAHSAALAALPRMTPARLGRLVAAGAGPEVWQMVLDDRLPSTVVHADARELRGSWAGVDPALPSMIAERCAALSVTVSVLGEPGYPEILAADRAAPAVLFSRGDLGALGRRRVAVIGTRNATRAGRWFARRLGESLAAEDIAVVSGLARGIDGEAHAGALAAGRGAPVAVVASGHDVVYPRENAWLWHEVAERGLVVGESPPGTAPEPHRFPLRNRIIAALSEALVVVESATTGGSMSTVEEAAVRGVEVMAVPGAPHARTSAGTNALLRDGCAPVTGVDDVLCAIGLVSPRESPIDSRVVPEGVLASVVQAVTPGPCSVDTVASICGLAPLEAAVCLGRLQQAGWVASTGGWWEALLDVRP
jgi:DNA processing protein